MSKIAFINPSPDFANIYGSLSEERSVLPPLGLCYLSNTIRSVGHDVIIIDAPALKISNDEAVRRALSWGARYVGVTSTTDMIFIAATIAQTVKSASAGTAVIIGGPHVTAVPAQTLEKFSAFDIGVIGEGEETIKELITALESGSELSVVSGIAYRSGGAIRLTAAREFIKDLDLLPYPAWDLLPALTETYRPAIINYKRLPSTSLVTSRGCPGSCAFCDTKVFGSKYRIHSSSYVLEMIRFLKERYGIRDICFYDDVFTIFKKRLVEICEGLREKRHEISWSCQARVNAVDYDMMKMMKEAGCWKISFGIESASNNVLKLMNKHIVVDQSAKAVREAKRAGLEVEGYFILGFFGETKETLGLMKEFIMASPLDTALLSYFLPFPGSPAYSRVKEYGAFDEDWKNMNVFDRPQYIPNGLTADDLVEAQNDIYKSFYFRPRMFAKYAARMVRHPSYAAKLVRSSLSLASFLFKK